MINLYLAVHYWVKFKLLWLMQVLHYFSAGYSWNTAAYGAYCDVFRAAKAESEKLAEEIQQLAKAKEENV